VKPAILDNNPADDVISHVLHFSVADTEFCLALQYVTRVFPIVKFRYVPGGPKYLRGLLTLEGRNLPVIDLADRLNLPDAHQYHLETPILLCDYGEKRLALIVDEMHGVEEVSEENLQMRPLFDRGNGVPFDAAIETRRGTSLLLHLDSIINIDLESVIEDMPEDPRKG